MAQYNITQWTMDQLLPAEALSSITKPVDKTLTEVQRKLQVLALIMDQTSPQATFVLGMGAMNVARFLAQSFTGSFLFLDEGLQMKAGLAATSLEMTSGEDKYLTGRLKPISGNDQSVDFSNFFKKMDMVVICSGSNANDLLKNSMYAFEMIRPGGLIAWISQASSQVWTDKAFKAIAQRFPLVQLTDVGLMIFTEEPIAKTPDLNHPDSQVSLSVIIPTCNRAQSLPQTVRSVLNQTMSSSRYEIIVVDNNSSDHTRAAVVGLNEECGGRIRYIFEPNPGLVYARHAGARAAKGEILCYIDDDATAGSNWLEAISKAFENREVVMVGGKILPKYETEPPPWIDDFWIDCVSGRHMGMLSLLDLGDQAAVIDSVNIWGCNFSIRKQTLFEVGGFNPDAFPWELIRYRGDGEGGLSRKINERGYKAYYQPGAVVYHHIPAGRLTIAYFLRRQFIQGVSDSFARIRREGLPVGARIDDVLLYKVKYFIRRLENSSLVPDELESESLEQKLHKAYEYGRLFHLYHVLADPELLGYVRQSDYLSPVNHKRADIETLFSAINSDGPEHSENIRGIDNYRYGLWLMEQELYHCAQIFLEQVKLKNAKLNGLDFSLALCLIQQGKAEEAELAALKEPKDSPYRSGSDDILKQIKADRARTRKHRIRTLVPEAIDISELPLTLDMAVVYITEMCNSRCITCNSWKNHSESQLDTEVWKGILTQIRGEGITSVAFVGGEPLLRQDLAELVAEARELRFSSILISTNGFLLNNYRMHELLAAGANSFHLSLDGLRDIYLRVRGRDWFEKVVQAGRTLSEKGADLVLLTILMRQNLAELEQIVAFADSLGAKWFPNILENGKYLFKGVDTKTLAISENAEIDQLVEKLATLKAKFPRTMDIDKPEIEYIGRYLASPEKEKHIPCTLGFEAVYLDPKANLYPACMSLKPIGNLNQTDFSGLIRSEKMKDRLQAMVLRKCPGCTCGYPQRAQDAYFRK